MFPDVCSPLFFLLGLALNHITHPDWSTCLAEQREDTDKKRLHTCRKKQWRTFKVQGVKRKSIIAAHKQVLEDFFFLCAIIKLGEAKRDFEFIEERL